MDKRPRLRFYLLAFAFLLCWGLALSRGQWAQAQYRGASARLHGGGVPHEVLGESLRQQASKVPLPIAAWSRGGKTRLANETTGAGCQVRPIRVYGDMEAVCPMTPLSGSLPLPGDEAGCVLDAASAWALFGSLDVVGAAVPFGGKDYVLRAVVEAKEGMLLLRDKEAAYENLELAAGSPEEAGAALSDFIFRYGLSQDYTLVEGGFYAALLAGLLPLPGLILAAALLFPLARSLWRRRNLPLQALLLLCGLAAGSLALGWLLGLTPYWPARFLPTQWSDFGFWGALFQQAGQTQEALSYLTPVPKDMALFGALKQGLLSLGAAALLAALLLRRPAGAAFTPRLWPDTLWLLLCAALPVLLLFAGGLAFLPTRGYLAALPLVFLRASFGGAWGLRRGGGPPPLPAGHSGPDGDG